MRSPRFLASSAPAQAVTAALAASLVYLLMGWLLDPENSHLGAAAVVGMTLGIHMYRRARVRMASQSPSQEHIST